MTAYRAPLRDLQFVIRELAGLDALAGLPGFGDVPEVLEAILGEAAAFATGVLDPLNAPGDAGGCVYDAGRVTMPPGFADAYRRYAQAGWIGLRVSPEYGGQGLPHVVAAATLEMWNAANVGFANAPLLNAGAIEALELCGSMDQRRRFIPRLVSGEWTGTMCLTEPQAGSDLAAVRASAVPDGDRYRLHGQKIFITFGEHDLAENIVHLVLARLPDAPAGSKGISLFIVPKINVDAGGALGAPNDVRCAGIEHKLGLHANPTCTMNYGEGEGALGELVGEPHRGLEYMFVMMNDARFSVGVQALGIADRAYQRALAYARERVQGRDIAGAAPEAVAIAAHPDVRRMLLTMKAQIEAMRALAGVVAASLDLQDRHPDPAERARHRAFAELMIPIVKGWCTETSVELCSTALQVFGGMGYVEETGIAQQYRDVRITTIYEGTTGIQALDLVGRKLLRDRGAAVAQTLAQIAADAARLDPAGAAGGLRAALESGVEALRDSSAAIGLRAASDRRATFACAVPYLKLWGIVAGGWQTARAAAIAIERIDGGVAEADFYRAKLATARFYADHVLSAAAWYRHQVVAGAAAVDALDDGAFDLDRRAPVAH